MSVLKNTVSQLQILFYSAIPLCSLITEEFHNVSYEKVLYY